MTAYLEVVGIHKSYGSIEVLKDVSLSVRKGETYAIIGPNGAGKTTLFRVLTGETHFAKGSVIFEGRDISKDTADERVNLGFGRTFQVARVFPIYTVEENIALAVEAQDRRTGVAGSFRWANIGLTPDVRSRCAKAAEDVGLAEKLHMEARHLSHGDKKRLEIALTLALGSRVLMMDEPTAGMSPSDRSVTVDLIHRLKHENGLTILLVEHDMDVVFGLADHVAVLSYGEVIAHGRQEEIRGNQKVREIYLGDAMEH